MKPENTERNALVSRTNYAIKESANTSAKPKRTRIKPVSDRQAARLKRWAKVKREYLKKVPLCECCSKARSTEVHHTRGKNGELRYNTTFLRAVCRPCHTWIDNNRAAARAKGMLCEYGLFNTPPKDNALHR